MDFYIVYTTNSLMDKWLRTAWWVIIAVLAYYNHHVGSTRVHVWISKWPTAWWSGLKVEEYKKCTFNILQFSACLLTSSKGYHWSQHRCGKSEFPAGRHCIWVSSVLPFPTYWWLDIHFRGTPFRRLRLRWRKLDEARRERSAIHLVVLANVDSSPMLQAA